MARKKKNRNNPLYYTIPMEESSIFHRKLQYMVAENTAKGLITFLSEKFSQESLKEMYERYQLGASDRKPSSLSETNEVWRRWKKMQERK